MTAETRLALPLTTNETFGESDLGKQLKHFAELVFSEIPDEAFPLLIGKAAGFLFFEEERHGVKSIETWHKAGLFKLDNPKYLTREELIIVKLTQALFTTQLRYYGEVHDFLKENLAGSDLEHLIGNLDNKKANIKCRLKLSDLDGGDGSWWVDLQSISPTRPRGSHWIDRQG